MKMMSVVVRGKEMLFASPGDAYLFLISLIYSSEGSEREGYVEDLSNFERYYDYTLDGQVYE